EVARLVGRGRLGRAGAEQAKPVADIDAGLHALDDGRGELAERREEALHLEVARLAHIRAGAERQKRAEAAAGEAADGLARRAADLVAHEAAEGAPDQATEKALHIDLLLLAVQHLRSVHDAPPSMKQSHVRPKTGRLVVSSRNNITCVTLLIREMTQKSLASVEYDIPRTCDRAVITA